MPRQYVHNTHTDVALRKESVDRNTIINVKERGRKLVALRKESVDRNDNILGNLFNGRLSLSARRAWIEMVFLVVGLLRTFVALRKESVDRNIWVLQS